MHNEEKRDVNTAAAEELYLDHNATTPMRHEAVEAMLPWLGQPANPASAHSAGRRAKLAVDAAREKVAALLGARPAEIVFTSGATESNNLALRNTPVGTLIVSATEHPSVLRTAEAMADQRRVIVIAPDASGQVPPTEVLAALGGVDDALVSVMLANNETGVLNDVQSISGSSDSRRALIHTDATQAAGRVPLDVDDLGVDLLSLSAHKFGGAQGVGILYVRRGTELSANAQTGGAQERDRRSGTLNVAGIVAAGAAAEAARSALESEPSRTRALRDRFEELILAAGIDAVVLGSYAPRLPNTSLIAIPGAPADAVMASAPHLVISHGSACSAGAPGPSHVLRAMGVPDALAETALRITFGPTNTPADAEAAASAVVAAATRVAHLTDKTLGGAA